MLAEDASKSIPVKAMKAYFKMSTSVLNSGDKTNLPFETRWVERPSTTFIREDIEDIPHPPPRCSMWEIIPSIDLERKLVEDPSNEGGNLKPQ